MPKWINFSPHYHPSSALATIMPTILFTSDTNIHRYSENQASSFDWLIVRYDHTLYRGLRSWSSECLISEVVLWNASFASQYQLANQLFPVWWAAHQWSTSQSFWNKILPSSSLDTTTTKLSSTSELKRLCLNFELSKLTTRSGKYFWRLMSFVRENWCERQFIPGWCPNLFRYFRVLSKYISNLRLPKLPKLRLRFGKSFFSSSEMTQRKP